MNFFLRVFCKLFFMLICGILFQNLYANPIDQNIYPLCESKDCVHHANMLNKNMNPEVDPCQDFYSFVCGGYKRKFGENDTHSVYDDSMNLLQTKVKNLLENLNPEEGSSSQKLKTVFENCMNIESSEMNAVSDAIDFLNHTGIPNWPYLRKDFSFAKLSDTLAVFAAYREFAFINFQPSPYGQKLSDTNSESPPLLLSGKFLLNSKRPQKDVYNAVVRILKYFNINKNEIENIWKEFMEVENFGIQLLEVSGKSQKCNHNIGVSHREVHCSGTRSMKFLCDLWRSIVKHGDLDKYYSTNIVHIPCNWNHFHHLDNIFSYMDKMSDRSLANYLSLRFFISQLDDLNLYFHLTKKTFPGDKRPRTPPLIKRWKYCVDWIMKYMNQVLGYEYTRNILTETTQNSVLDITKDYVDELSISLKNLPWLDESIKLYLQKQLKHLDIGFKKTMNNYRNRTYVENFYKRFHPEKGSFLKNILDYQKMSLVTKEKPHFNSFSSSSDPYTMDFGVGLLQPPTFADGLPKIWNYATLGYAIGHELSHNFKFFFDFVHLDEITENNLNNKTQCFVEQLSQFLMQKRGKRLTSSEAKEEVIADNLGWELTEKIINKMMKNETNKLLTLFGLDYTPLQLAYISFAQDSCAVLSKDVEAELYATKPQNLPYLRMFGVLQNSKTFSSAFNCAKGDLMNPENKCTFFE